MGKGVARDEAGIRKSHRMHEARRTGTANFSSLFADMKGAFILVAGATTSIKSGIAAYIISLKVQDNMKCPAIATTWIHP